MVVNWIHRGEEELYNLEALLDLEYEFRSKITKALLADQHITLLEEFEDLDDITVNFCPVNKAFTLSNTTPEPLFTVVSKLIDSL